MVVTDKLRSYGAAHRQVMPGVEHRTSKYLNNRAESSHQPTRQRERAMKRFTSPSHAQRFLSAFSGVSPPLPTPTPPPDLSPVPHRDDRALHHLEAGHRHGRAGLTTAIRRGGMRRPALTGCQNHPNTTM